MMGFEFATATRIIFGAGKLREIGSLIKESGKRALVTTGRTIDRAQPLRALLDAAGISSATFPVAGEPTIDIVTRGAQFATAEQCDVVVGFGGGSAIDAGKAIAALMTNEGDIFDYVEVIGRGKALVKAPLPFIAIPTTAGTGTEVTRNAVLASPEHRVKVSLRGLLLLPKVALVDPELTCNLPPAITASTGLDALTQLIEPFVSCRANPLTDALCREGMKRAARSLRRAFDDGTDKAAREDMALASLFGGIALANAGLGAVHGFAAPIGGMFSAPHGAVCAALLPHVMEVNVRALRQRAPGSESLQRFDEVARILTNKLNATAVNGIAWVRELCAALKIPRLGSYGITADHSLELVERAAVASSMKANPIVLTQEELKEILMRAL
jgi:alcohol dehydrogenase class IV